MLAVTGMTAGQFHYAHVNGKLKHGRTMVVEQSQLNYFDL